MLETKVLYFFNFFVKFSNWVKDSSLLLTSLCKLSKTKEAANSQKKQEFDGSDLRSGSGLKTTKRPNKPQWSGLFLVFLWFRMVQNETGLKLHT